VKRQKAKVKNPMSDYPTEVRHAAQAAYLHLREMPMDDATFTCLVNGKPGKILVSGPGEPKAPKRPIGRPRKNPEDLSKRPTLSLRVRQPLYDVIKAAALANGRSMSEEMEARIEGAFAISDVAQATADAVAAILRERSPT
jgi:hypothetical protein